ncbi:MAG: DUF1761 domain-containing protein [Rhodothermales bacterium]
MYPEVNYLAVFVASLIPMVVGSLWYGPLFGQKWMGMIGKTEEELRADFNPAKTYGITWVFAFIMAYVMAHVLGTWNDAYGSKGWMAGVQAGFWLWLGFVLTIGYQRVAFENVSTGLWGLNTLYNLVTLMAMGILLSVW